MPVASYDEIKIQYKKKENPWKIIITNKYKNNKKPQTET